MGFHARFKRGNSDVVKSTLDIQEDPQSELTIKNRFFYVTNNSAQGYVTRVIFPEGMLIVVHRRGYKAGLFSFPQHELFQSFKEE
jgi:hypothetical protein